MLTHTDWRNRILNSGSIQYPKYYQCETNETCEWYTLPTQHPTSIPTLPTSQPTGTTMLPTTIPTTYPTEIPSQRPSELPTSQPTEIPTKTDSLQLKQLNAKYIQGWETVSIIIIIVCIALGLIFTILSSLLYDSVVIKLARTGRSSHSHRKFNTPKHYRIWIFFQNIGDLWTDLMSSIVLYLEGFEILSYFASFFTILPFIVQLFVAIKFVLKWKHWKTDNPNRLTSYIKKYEIIIYLLSIVSGFYNTIDLFQSEVFYLKLFKFSLKSDEYNALRPYRFVNIVILENLPQLTIQIMYLLSVTNEGTIYKASTIVFISMVFSVLGLLFAFIKEISRQLDNRHNKQSGSKRKLQDNNTQYISTINGSLLIESKDLTHYHNFCHKKVATCLETCLNTCKDNRKWVNRHSVKYDIEVYYINDMLSTLNQIEICYEIKISYNRFDLQIFCDTLRSIGDAQSKNQQKMIKVELHA